MKYQLKFIEMAIIKIKETSTGEVLEKLEPSCIAGGNVKWCSLFGEQFGSFLKY